MPEVSLYGARVIRDRAAKAGEKVSRRVPPRQRFLAEQRARLAGWMVPIMATAAALSGAIAAIELATGSPSGAEGAAVAQAIVALLVGSGTIGIQLTRRKETLLFVLAGAACSVALLGWGAVAQVSGGATSPYLLVVPLLLVVSLAVAPIPPRVAWVVAPVGYAALLVGSVKAPIAVHVLVLGIMAGGVFVAHSRHRRILRAFMRVERLSAAARRLRRLQEQLVLVEKLEALRVLVGGMAHELNNALAISVASAQQAKKLAGEESPAGAAVKRAEGGLARIRTTVERLRRFAMAAEEVLEPADVAAMLDFALESAIGRARSGVIVERAYEPEVGTIQCHVSALAEALFQVARNAVEAMPGGGTIRASARSEGDRVALSVADEGKGLSAEQLKRVFDPYWRTQSQANRSGMGLSAVYGLVTAMGGSVRVESAEGRGTKVTITMPRRR